MQELCARTQLTRLERAVPTDFVAASASGSYLQRDVDLSGRPGLPSLASLRELVEEKLRGGGLRWYGGREREEGEREGVNQDIVCAIKAEWMFSVIRASELMEQNWVS